MDGERVFGSYRSLPRSVAVGVLTNATYTGYVTVMLPLVLSAKGVDKVGIAGFFVTGAVTAAVLNITVGRALRRLGAPRVSVAICALTSGAGLLIIAAPGAHWRLYPAAAALLATSLIYPLYVGVAATGSTQSDTRTAGAVRGMFIAGYLLGLGLYSLTTLVQDYVSRYADPLMVGVALAFVMSMAAGLRHPVARSIVAGSAVPRPDEHARRAVVALAVISGAVLLMRAADSLRQVYLPLYATAEGFPRPLIAILFATTVVAEILVLAPLGRLAEHLGSHVALLLVCVLGICSFGLTITAHGYLALIASQLVYAVFAAGFQSIGMVLFGESVRSGLGGGAGIYMAVVQLGGTVGVVSPLIVPGYSAEIFWFAIAFCVLAAGALVVDARIRSIRISVLDVVPWSFPRRGRR